MHSTDILAYPIDSVANIVNSIKEDKIAKEQNFAFLYELQHLRKVLFGLFARSSDSRANRLITASLFIHAPKEKASEAITKYARSVGAGGRGGTLVN